MKVIFDTSELEELYVTPLAEIRGKQRYPVAVLKQYKKKIALLTGLDKLEDLKPFKGLNFEYLHGDRKGQCSVRLNDQYRLIFVPTAEGTIQVLLIKEISKHYE